MVTISTFIFTYGKKACFQVSNNMDLFINETISKWQTKLKLNTCVYWTTNFDFYDRVHKTFRNEEPAEKGKVAGCMSGINMMYLSKAAHQFSFEELEKSIVHELLHMRYPNKSESWIVKKTNGVLK